MGKLASTFRRMVADTLASALGGGERAKLVALAKVSADGDGQVVYTRTFNGLRCTVVQDYPDAPWSWTVEGADGRLVAFRGSSPTYESAVDGLSQWLASEDGEACQGGKREGFDVPPRAA